MPAAAARHNPNLAVTGRIVGQIDPLVAVMNFHAVAVRGKDALDGLVHKIRGLVDDLFHTASSLLLRSLAAHTDTRGAGFVFIGSDRV